MQRGVLSETSENLDKYFPSNRVSKDIPFAVFDGMQCLYKLKKARFAGIVRVLEATTPELVKLA